MDNSIFKNRLNNYINLVDAELEKFFSNVISSMGLQKHTAEAMYYSISAGGKRIRPVLVMEFCRMCGGNPEKSLPAACAIEMIHTFSLIHDDLPCMDNDDMRRGKPSCHKAYGEATALLAGDALENMAFGTLAESTLPDKVKVKAIKELSYAVGMYGMIGGQVIDTEYESKLDSEQLIEMYRMKTGALLKAACRMGCICAEADTSLIEKAAEYADSLGLAFQIIDDILDIIGDAEKLGKPIGSDASNGKLTYASINGIERSSEYAEKQTQIALNALDSFDDNEFIKELTIYLLKRSS